MRASVLPLLVAVFASMLLLSSVSPSNRLVAAREAVAAALERGDHAVALEVARGLLGSTPDTAGALLETSRLLVRAGDAPQALWLLESGVERFPKRDEIRLELARVALLLGSPSLARSAAESIGAESPFYVEARLALAQANLGLGNLDGGLAVLGALEQHHPDRPEIRLSRIATLLTEQRSDEAAEAIVEALALLGNSDEDVSLRRRLELARAQIRAAGGDREGALAALRSLLEADPEEAVLRPLTRLLLEMERGDEAVRLLEEALVAEPGRVLLHRLLGSVHTALGDEAAAEGVLRAAAEKPVSAAALLPLADFYTTRGENERAEQVFRAGIEQFPEDPRLRLMHTEALLAVGRIDEARAALSSFRRATFAGDVRVEYLRARLELVDGHPAAAARRLERLAPRLDTAETQLRLGQALEAMGDLEGAQRRYILASQRNPEWLGPTSALVALAHRREDWASLAFRAGEFVRRAPGFAEGWEMLAQALLNLGEASRAEDVARRGVERFPDRLALRLLRARALRELARHEEALAELESARTSFPAGPELEAETALVLTAAGRTDEAMGRLQVAVERWPEVAMLHGTLGSLLFAMDAAEAGARAVERALALDPDDLRPRWARCRYYAATGRLGLALADCTRVAAVRSEDAEAHFTLGLVHEGLGHLEQAIASYRRSAALDPSDFRPRNNLAAVLARRGELGEALAAAQQAYRLADGDPRVGDTLGALYLEKGLVERSLAVLEQARASAPDLPELGLHLALAYRAADRDEEARALLETLADDAALRPDLRRQVREALDSLP